MFDVWVMIGFGVLGFALDRFKIPLAPFVIGFVLAPMAEESLCSALMLSGGSWAPFVTRPVSLLLLVIALGIAITSLVYRPTTQKPTDQE